MSSTRRRHGLVVSGVGLSAPPAQQGTSPAPPEIVAPEKSSALEAQRLQRL